MEALVSALGSEISARLRFSVVAPNGTLIRQGGQDRLLTMAQEPAWAALLRLASGMIWESETDNTNEEDETWPS
jgi:hypothetical protein